MLFPPSYYLDDQTTIDSILVITVADDALPIVTLNSTLAPLITPSNVPNILPVAIADSSMVVTVVPS